MGMENAILPVVIEQAADNTLRNIAIAVGGTLVVGAIVGTVLYVCRDKNPKVTEATNLAANALVEQVTSVQALRDAALNKALAPAREQAKKDFPCEILDNPMGSLAALSLVNNKG